MNEEALKVLINDFTDDFTEAVELYGALERADTETGEDEYIFDMLVELGWTCDTLGILEAEYKRRKTMNEVQKPNEKEIYEAVKFLQHWGKKCILRNGYYFKMINDDEVEIFNEEGNTFWNEKLPLNFSPEEVR